MKRRMAKWLTLFPFLLLIACTLNLCVAWACCLWSPRRMRTESGIVTAPLFDPQTAAGGPASPFGVKESHTPIKVYYLGPGFRSMTVSWLTTTTVSIRSIQHVHPVLPPTETVIEAGWPVRCVRMHEVKSAIGQPVGDYAISALKQGVRIPPRPAWLNTAPITSLPIDPIPARFALGSGFYFAVTLIPVAGIAAARYVRRVRRRARGECEHCGYEAGRSGPCPECGRRVGRAEQEAPSQPSLATPPVNQ